MPRSKLDGNARQISLEGYANHPKFTPDGNRLLYLSGKTASGPKELWMAELDTGRNEPVLPGFRLNENESRRVPYDISPDGQRVVVEVSDAQGRNRLWLAPLDRRPTPRQIPNVEGDGRCSSPTRKSSFAERKGTTASHMGPHRRHGAMEAIRSLGHQYRQISRDGKWLVVHARPSEERFGGTLALPLGGGPPIQIVGRFVRAAWSTSPSTSAFAARRVSKTLEMSVPRAEFHGGQPEALTPGGYFE